jgi:hypothetical protein
VGCAALLRLDSVTYNGESDGAAAPSGTCCGCFGSEETLATGQDDPHGIVVDESNAYWVNPSSGTLASVPKAGGTTTALLSGLSNPRSLA